MKLLALAVLWAVMQATPPVPRQTINPSTGTGQAVQNHPKSNKKPAEPPSPIVQTVSTQPNQNSNASNSPKKDEKPIEIGKLPAVSVSRDAIDYLGLGLTFILLIVGYFGVRAAYRTLTAIEAQVVAQNESLRARMTVGFYDNPFKRNMQETFSPTIVLKFINTGGTPAYKIIPESWIEVCPIPFSDFTDKAVYHKGDPIIVYPDNPIPYPVPLGRTLTDDEKKLLWSTKCCICIRIRLTYETIGGEKFSDFAYASWPTGMAILPKYYNAN
jgi:hypothetical protein